MASEPAAAAAPLPPGVRSGIRRLMAILHLRPTAAELMRSADDLDMRDLRPAELAYLEDVHPGTVSRWRVDGTGPTYRNAGGIRYPILDYLAWREKGRQRLTSQGTRGGRRSDLE